MVEGVGNHSLIDVQRALFFEAITDPAYIVDQQSGVFLDVNAAAALAYGYTREEMLALNVTEISAEPEAVLKTLANPEAVNLRLHKRRNGTTFHVEFSTRVVEWGGRTVLVGIARDVSPRTRVEQALRDSEALLSTAFHHSPLLMSVAELATDRYLEVNETFATLIGCTQEEMVGRTAVELGLITVPERDHLAQQLMASLGRSSIEMVIRRRNGRPLICKYWGTIVPTVVGPKLFAAAEDITAYREAQLAREEAFSRLEKIASRVPGVVYQYRQYPDGRSCFPFSSAGIREIYRVGPEDVREDASLVFARLHPESLEPVAASIQASATNLTPWREDYRVKFEDGVVRWLHGDAVPEREADGSVLWHGHITDITERKQAEEALKTSEQRFELAMEATTDGLWDWDITTGAAYFSPGYYRMLGFDADTPAANATTWRDLIHPDDRALSQQHAQDCIEGRSERFEFEYRLRTKSGDWRWILTRGKCVARDEGGRALRLLGTHVDTTERKRLQASLAQNDRLASMGMLAAGVAHEINNPLAYVLANLESLAHELPRLVGLTGRLASAVKTRLGEEALEEILGDGRELAAAAQQDLIDAAEGALEGTRRITKISRGLGTFARVERPELDTVDVNLAIETAATMAHNEVKYRATLVKDLGQLPPVLATDGKLAQVFLNLLINASLAIDEGDAEHHRITIRTWAAADSVFVEVADTGHGIPPENLERIFEPFFTTRKVGLGSGLGLSISRNIITEFGGDIHVESEVGVGTRVLVRLPVSVKKAEKTIDAVVPAAGPGARGRVLVVDDEEAIRRSLVRVLHVQHDVVTAASGREAKALLEHDPAFDVILCDLMMPDLTGMDLHDWLLTTHPTLADRCVFISGGAFTPSASGYLASVPNRCISKPFDLASLRAAVAELVVAAKRVG